MYHELAAKFRQAGDHFALESNGASLDLIQIYVEQTTPDKTRVELQKLAITRLRQMNPIRSSGSNTFHVQSLPFNPGHELPHWEAHRSPQPEAKCFESSNEECRDLYLATSAKGHVWRYFLSLAERASSLLKYSLDGGAKFPWLHPESRRFQNEWHWAWGWAMFDFYQGRLTFGGQPPLQIRAIDPMVSFSWASDYRVHLGGDYSILCDAFMASAVMLEYLSAPPSMEPAAPTVKNRTDSIEPDGPVPPQGIRFNGFTYRLTPRAYRAAVMAWSRPGRKISLIDASDDHVCSVKLDTAKQWRKEFNHAVAESGWEMAVVREHIIIRETEGTK